MRCSRCFLLCQIASERTLFALSVNAPRLELSASSESLLDISSLVDSCPAESLGPLPTGPLKEAELARRLECPEREPALERAFAYWWGQEKLSPNLFAEFCNRVRSNDINAGRIAPLYAFAVILHKGQVHMSCCDSHPNCQAILDSGLKDHEDLRDSIGLLQDLLTVADLDMQFILAFGDEPFTSQVLYSNVPVFHPSGSESHWTIPLPSVYHTRALLRGVLDNTTLGSMPWEHKKPKLWWRGTLTALSTTLLSTAEFTPRLRLMKLAAKNPEILDVAFSGVHVTLELQWGGRKAIQQLLQRVQARLVDHEDFWDNAPLFKFILIVPGITQSPQLSNVLRSGSVPLLVADVTFEHLHPLLEPWIHFVPIRPDLSDLIPALEYLRKNDDVAKRIAQAAQELASQRLRPTGTYCYLWRAMRALRDLTAEQGQLIRSSAAKLTRIPAIDLKRQNGFRPLRERLEL